MADTVVSSRPASVTHFEANAPGKLIILGEHAAVFGLPAVVASIGLRTRAGILPVAGDGVELDLPDLSLRRRCSWEEVLEYGAGRREVWNRARAGHEADVPRGSDDEAGFVKVVLAEAMRALGACRDLGERPGLRASVRSELPVGSGLGSSASVAVALSAALLGALGQGAELRAGDERIAAIAFEAEKRQHGQPSGVDHTAVIRGGFLAVTRDGDGLKAEDLARPAWFREAIRVYDTGTPAESTGEVVAAVDARRGRDPEHFAGLLERMERATRTVMTALGESGPRWPELVGAFRGFERCLEELGVVPDAVTRVVRGVEAAGGAAKISGAGSLSGSTAGSLIVLAPPDAEARATLDAALAPYRRIDAPLGVRGLTLGGGR